MSNRPNRNKGKKLGQVLSILPGGGGVSLIPDPLCLANLFPNEFQGQWICFHGFDGTSHGPGGSFSATGSPVTQSLATNLNGPNCAVTTGQKLDGSTQYFETGAVATPSGSVSLGIIYSTDDTAAAEAAFSGILTRDNQATNRVISFGAISSSRVGLFVSKDGTAVTTLASAANAISSRASHFVLGTYQYVADGTSVGTIYVDGAVSGTPSSTLVGPLYSVSAPWTVGSYKAGLSKLSGRVRGAIITEKVLSAATVQAMSDVCLGKVTGSFGEALTYTRAGTTTIATPGGGAMTLQPNRMPIIGGGLLMEPAGTNLILQSEAPATTPWVANGVGVAAPTPTNNTTDVVAPDGTSTAGKVVFPDCSGSTSSFMYVPFTVSAADHTVSMWVRTASGSYTFNFMVYTPAGTYGHYTATATTTWTRIQLTKTFGAGTGYLRFGRDKDDPLGVDIAAGTLYCWGVQGELGPMTSYMRSGAGTGSRSQAVTSTANPLYGLNPNIWSMSARLHLNALSTTLADVQILNLGTYSTSNWANLCTNGSTGWPRLNVKDNSGTLAYEYSIEVLPADFSINGSFNIDNQYIWVDGVRRAKNGGTSNGISTQQSTLYIGAGLDGGSLTINPIKAILSNIIIKNKKEI